MRVGTVVAVTRVEVGGTGVAAAICTKVGVGSDGARVGTGIVGAKVGVAGEDADGPRVTR